MNPGDDHAPTRQRRLLLLHGSRQTGELLLGRMAKLKSKLRKQLGIELCAVDAPHRYKKANMKESSEEMDRIELTWWHYDVSNRDSVEYRCDGLVESLEKVANEWDSSSEKYCYEGIIGFSQGARLAHYISLLHQLSNGMIFPGLKYAIMTAGYDDPLPVNDLVQVASTLDPTNDVKTHSILSSNEIHIDLPSLHIYGMSDRLIEPIRSKNVMQFYNAPKEHFHDGGHHFPMRSNDIQVILNFIALSADRKELHSSSNVSIPYKFNESILPNDDQKVQQQEEIEVLETIYPDEFKLLSDRDVHPIRFEILLEPAEDHAEFWPTNSIHLQVTYPPTYPDTVLDAKAGYGLSLRHSMNVFEFPSSVEKKCLQAAVSAANDSGEGVPHVLACITAIREFFDTGGLIKENVHLSVDAEIVDETSKTEAKSHKLSLLPAVQTEKMIAADDEGKLIAKKLLENNRNNIINIAENDELLSARGGSWKFVIGLVGKPSAGKSTFFNAATCFARQRDKQGYGASMAPHPFTTIDPNIGYCFVPAPYGSCPEDREGVQRNMLFGNTHGRDSRGRRLLPVVLKDVAGLVPGAYEGRGKGNKFLDDLTDADVLIHVVDSSGKSDSEGNIIESDQLNNPIDDLSWVRNELLAWIESNLAVRWESICRKGRSKLADMFTGYKQQQRIIWETLLAFEKYMYEHHQKDKILDHLTSWDSSDLRRLVSTFLGFRFPMALALNKADVSTAKSFISEIQKSLPIHGAIIGTAVCAYEEMMFMRTFIPVGKDTSSNIENTVCGTRPLGVWDTLTSAISLRPPLLVFPVNDFTSYLPLPGMNERAIRDASLPNLSMIRCLKESDGSIPSMWDDTNAQYNQKQTRSLALRDVLVMKPGSTIEDAFLHLKRVGAISGEFVRAEGAGEIGEKPKPQMKNALIGKHNRILKIMTNKRRSWQ